MSTDERDGLCDSRGPRIGSEGRPLCGLPKYHQGRHKPDPGAGWPETLTWSDVSFAGIPNVARADKLDPPTGKDER